LYKFRNLLHKMMLGKGLNDPVKSKKDFVT